MNEDEIINVYWLYIDGRNWVAWSNNKIKIMQLCDETRRKHPNSEYTIETVQMTRKEYNGIMMA